MSTSAKTLTPEQTAALQKLQAIQQQQALYQSHIAGVHQAVNAQMALTGL